MSTPGAIAVYTTGSGIPEHVSSRPWRGVYHHWDGYPIGLGQHLMWRVKRAGGDLGAVVARLIDEAPWGWSTCMMGGDGAEDDRKADEDSSLPVSPDATGGVAYVYVFDLEARRLDAFATYAGGGGKRLGSVVFSPEGMPDRPALDLLPEETVVEPPLPGEELSAEALQAYLEGLPKLASDSKALEWVLTQEGPEGWLLIIFRVLTFVEGALHEVAEYEWDVVTPAARREPERVRNFLDALVDVVREDPRSYAAVWIANLDSLRRSEARRRESFVRILKAHRSRDFDSEESS
ncbi:hypothetical protein LZ198_37995 [Myxococcus sp. K15C18031901]|uniref:hypothetical protein n=1 Tax=Myxococcus dinghuensis TaxID=2906761 RepID=UPI0020A82EAB|nr:hypothetical protein [Myxococcus dinghuensis]MCP3104673.1 hypothetical protein [Myxococcus dinghuensis]